MNTITRRLVAGVSATAMLLSAVGSDAYKSLFTKTVSADSASSPKNAKSTGFDNLEQDTDKDGNYNTGYGLHTNKTAASVGDDGRTFDVNLESWYVGENPVDVATVLDASGSMAWTVDTLEPLEIAHDEKDIIKYLGVKDKNSADLNNDDKADINDLIEYQNKNGGYLPQDVVDLILDNTKTDNSKLGYDKYKYYVYEARSSVSEFVPLGYWDGGIDPKTDPSLIGYYPFSGDLKNKAPKADGTSGMLINHPAGNESYDTTKAATEKPEAVFATKKVDIKDNKGKVTGQKDVVEGLNIADSASKGAILVASPTTENFSISFKMTIDQNENDFNEATILYLTDGENSYRIFRGGSSSPNRLKISTSNGKTPLNANKATNSEPREWQFTFDFTNNQLKIHTSTQKVEWVNSKDSNAGSINGKSDYTVSLNDCPKLDVSKLKIYIGGNTTKPEKKVDDIYIQDLTINNISGDVETAVATYPLQTEDDGFTNTVDGGTPAIFVEQAYNNSGNFGEEELALRSLDPVIKDNKYLDVKATSQNGAVSLDAVPELDTDGFTISMKLYRTASLTKTDNNQQNIFYYGDKNKNNNYYQYFRSANAGGFLGISKNEQKDMASTPTGTDMVYYKGGMASGSDKEEVWYTNTLVFKPDPENKDRVIVTPYINGKPEYQDTTNINTSIDSISVDKKDLVLLLCALKKNGSGSNQYLDDLYVFNTALNKDIVNAYFGDNTVSCDVDGATHALSYVKNEDGTFVKNEDGSLKTIEIAQISNGDKRLGKNTNIDQRRGWYYVNSASNWADIEGCLASGKQYIGIFNDDGLKNGFSDMAKDVSTLPAGFAESTDDKKQSIAKGIADGDNKESLKYSPPSTERSIRFYVDNQNHLRCFAWSGATTKNKGDERTFCSVVYEKKDNQKSKYQELNSALNTFNQNLASYSDLSNTSVVRYSTNNAVDKSKTNVTDTNLKKLIMKNWTSWSDEYLASGNKLKEEEYLQDLLGTDGKSAITTTKKDGVDQYPYVMTGGTYTWTGLKAFYDNMVDKKDLESGDRVYDVANDARDKYLIIFTDGRDNTQDYDVLTTENDKTKPNTDVKLKGSPDYDNVKKDSTFAKTDYVKNYNPYADEPEHKVGFSIENYTNNFGNDNENFDPEYQVEWFKTGDHQIKSDGDLAQAWADKIKEEGYTIYCVMLATGSISEYANEDEYNKAYNFLRSLAGGGDEIKELEDQIAACMKNGTKPDEIARYQKQLEELKKNQVIVVDPSQEGGLTITQAFQQILDDIQKPRNDYIVQDYIDPRFELIGKAYTYTKGTYESIDGDIIYHLGANGKVTFTDINNKPLESENGYIYFDDGYGSKTSYSIDGVTVKDIIDDPNVYGLAYTPQDSYMVNRKPTTDPKSEDGYDWGNNGTGYLYYDDEKDMYYLRWEDQVIPMEDKAFDTEKATGDKKLNVWSATIRLKAKDDFIGGNNILTNGNEAGENLVYSDATIENMDKNPELYFTDGKKDHTLREKLQVLSGTNRKINAVDAGGVSQAVYGDGIDIPSSGFPRTTVNVRLLNLDAKNLNDVIYMGEVVSPTMMLADLENNYMTGSYYLQYLERYAYRVYGEEADSMPLIELLNKWLKINDKEEASKTFTIPYIYLPDPEYGNDGKLVKNGGKVNIQNSTGASWDGNNVDFTDLNLRDVTGFITYTWKRDDESKEDQQLMPGTNPKQYDITKEYVVKNTNQIKYNLQLKFTPLQEDDLPTGFTLDDNFIKADSSGKGGDKFFSIADGEFDNKGITVWSIKEDTNSNRTHYLQAMVKEQHTYTPHVEYNNSTKKWQLLNDTAAAEKTNEDTYDWDSEYKEAAGSAQIEKERPYTTTPENVKLVDAAGKEVTADTEPCSLVANTTYTKDVVNGALALELVVDGKYLKPGSEINPNNGTEKTFTFKATREYNDPLDPLPYGGDNNYVGADTYPDRQNHSNMFGISYQLTFKVDATSIPNNPQNGQLYTVWAKLTNVEAKGYFVSDPYTSITQPATDKQPYLGYEKEDALPIGTYRISPSLSDEQFKISNDGESFKYLKIDNAPTSYTYDRFPTTVTGESKDAPADTNDPEYLINNGSADYSTKNIAESKGEDSDEVTFYFGTDDAVVRDVRNNENKGESVKENPETTKDYAKDRLGIILLSADPNALSISKTVENYRTGDTAIENREWSFDLTITSNDFEWYNDHDIHSTPNITLEADWFKRESGTWVKDTTHTDPITVTVEGERREYTLTCSIKLKHNEKVTFKNLPEGTWKVVEKKESDIFYSAHNNAHEFVGDEWLYQNTAETEEYYLKPNSEVQFINELPYNLPSTGGEGITRYIFLGTAFTGASVLLTAMLWYDRRKRRTAKKQP